MLAPIDNYEKAFTTIAKSPKADRTLLALTYILTLDRVPLLYAGDELGVAFTEVGGAFPADRNASPFLQKVTALIALRNREPALRRGDFTEIRARDSVYAYERTLDDDRILVVLNSSGKPRKFSAPLGSVAWKDCRLDDLITSRVAKSAGEAGPIRVEPFGSRVVRVSDYALAHRSSLSAGCGGSTRRAFESSREQPHPTSARAVDAFQRQQAAGGRSHLVAMACREGTTGQLHPLGPLVVLIARAEG